MKKLLGLAITGATLLLLGACGQQNKAQNTDNEELKVITTFYPMYDFTKNIVGDAGNVELLIPAGTEPHDYEPSAKDLAKISDADVFVYNSDEMETWVAKVLDNIDTSKVKVIEASEGIQLMEGGEHEHEADADHDADHDSEEHDHEAEDAHDHELDPHVWLDPVLAKQEVATIEKGLAEAKPAEKDTFAKNSAAYQAKLTDLDGEFQAAFKDAKERTFVTQHAAFGYLARQYDLTQESISGISPDQEPSPSRIAELKHYVEDHGLKVIYFEKSASSKIAETLAQEANVELSVLNPLESLSQAEQDKGADYLSVMRDNLKNLQKSIH